MDESRYFEEFSELPIIAYRISRKLAQGKNIDEQRFVSGMQFHAMFILHKKGKLNMTELAGYLIMTRQQLTKLVDSLVEKGLVERGADPKNRRYVMIELSENGRAFMEEMVDHQFRAASRFFSSLSEEDAKRFTDALTVIKEIFSKF